MKIRGCLVGKIARKRLDRVAGEDEGRGRACIALPRAGNRTRLGSQARPEKKEPPVPAARSVKQGGVKVQRWLDDARNLNKVLTRLDASAAQSMSASLRKRPKLLRCRELMRCFLPEHSALGVDGGQVRHVAAL